jgi:hypothetical protein
MSKIKKYDELSSDIDRKDLEIDIEKLKGEYQIEEILDIFTDPKDIPVKEGVMGVKADLSNKEIKRGEIIYITALVRKAGHSVSSPAVQSVIKLRVVDIYHGLSMLNKVINQ